MLHFFFFFLMKASITKHFREYVFIYPKFSVSISQLLLADFDFVIFADSFLVCSISLLMMNLVASVLDCLTCSNVLGSASFKPKISLTKSLMLMKTKTFRFLRDATLELQTNILVAKRMEMIARQNL